MGRKLTYLIGRVQLQEKDFDLSFGTQDCVLSSKSTGSCVRGDEAPGWL